MLKKFRIDAVPGENIKSVSATLMSISRRIWYSKDHSFPSEFLNTILKLYQTSSVPEFNAHFSSLTTDRRKEFADRRVAFLTSTTVTTPSAFLENLITIQRICDGANIVYEQLLRDGLWNAVVKTKTTPHILNTTTVPSPSKITAKHCTRGTLPPSVGSLLETPQSTSQTLPSQWLLHYPPLPPLPTMAPMLLFGSNWLTYSDNSMR
jgi:hypothetical protein